MSAERVDWITSDSARLAWPKSDHYFDKCFCAQVRGEMIVLGARTGERLHGYFKVVWKPDYRPFREQGIPEIQDLNVVPVTRRNGIATRLMDAAERIVADCSAIVGIGVGLHPGYAAAQRMYALRGYVPDAMSLPTALNPQADRWARGENDD